jgi:predicted transcriptional regulator of viral defense system
MEKLITDCVKAEMMCSGVKDILRALITQACHSDSYHENKIFVETDTTLSKQLPIMS